jgi:hypothetical protein
VLERVAQRGREQEAQQQQHVDLQVRAHLRRIAPKAQGKCREPWRRGLNQRFSEEEGQTDAEQHQRNADRDVVDTRPTAEHAVQCPEQSAQRARRGHTQPGRAAEVRDAIAAHGAHD